MRMHICVYITRFETIQNILSHSLRDLNLSGKLERATHSHAAATGDTSCLFECFIWLLTNVFFLSFAVFSPRSASSLSVGRERGEKNERRKTSRSMVLTPSSQSRKAIIRFSRLRRRLFLVWTLTRFGPPPSVWRPTHPPTASLWRSCPSCQPERQLLVLSFRFPAMAWFRLFPHPAELAVSRFERQSNSIHFVCCRTAVLFIIDDVCKDSPPSELLTVAASFLIVPGCRNVDICDE